MVAWDSADAFEELAGQAKDDTAKPLQSQGFRRPPSVAFFFEGEFSQGSPAPFWRHFRRAARQQIRLSSALKKTFGETRKNLCVRTSRERFWAQSQRENHLQIAPAVSTGERHPHDRDAPVQASCASERFTRRLRGALSGGGLKLAGPKRATFQNPDGRFLDDRSARFVLRDRRRGARPVACLFGVRDPVHPQCGGACDPSRACARKTRTARAT